MQSCGSGTDSDDDNDETLPLLPSTHRRPQRWRNATPTSDLCWQWLQRPLVALLIVTSIFLVSTRPDIGIYFKHSWSDKDYPSLIDGTESTRVLYIEPGSGNQRIQTRLETVTFEERPSYSALSYTWGDAKVPMKLITVNDKRRKVSEHLWSALQNIRDPRERLAIWVDAICINQQDEAEKSRQVGLMSFTYSRADEVLVWLGHHQAPRWVENSSPSQWKGSWAVDLADEYWGSALYWIYRLVHQEYWKRAWVVQEIGMAKNVRVYFGRHAIPWPELVKLVKLYDGKVDDPAVQHVLHLERLRRSKYNGGSAYTLINLLDGFRDSFSSVALDKVYAFISMATHFGDEVVSANYSRSVFELYQDLTVLRNVSAVANEEKRIEAAYFSGLVRQILAREPSSEKKKLKYFGAINDPDTYLYEGCGDGRRIMCRNEANMTLGLAFMDGATWTKNWLLSWIIWPHHEVEAIWRPSPPESLALWLPQDSAIEISDEPENIRVQAIIVSEIRHIGPSYIDYLSNPAVAEEWASSVENLFVGENDIRRARVQIQRLEALLSKSGDLTPRHVAALQDEESASRPKSRLFVGTDFTMGLVPSGAHNGDAICQFWNSSASVLLRRDSPGSAWTVVGRSAVITSTTDGGDSGDPRIEWDRPEDQIRFFSHGSGGGADLVDLGLTLSQMTRLTLDTALFHNRNPSEPDEDQYPLDWTV